MLNIFMKGSLMTLRHEKIQHRPGGKKKKVEIYKNKSWNENMLLKVNLFLGESASTVNELLAYLHHSVIQIYIKLNTLNIYNATIILIKWLPDSVSY